MDEIALSKEIDLLSLLRQLQTILSRSLNSLPGKPPPTTSEVLYLVSTAASLNSAADGYIILRESDRFRSSKILVRAALEALFKGAAVVKERGFLFRIAYSEWCEERKMFADDPAYLKELDNSLVEIERGLTLDQPGYPLKRQKAKILDIAEAGGMKNIYNTTYRVYCKFTHGALAATEGEMDEHTDPRDTELMGLFVIMMLELLKKETPAEIPDLGLFRSKFAP